MIRWHEGIQDLMRPLASIRPHWRDPLTEDVDVINERIDRIGVFAPILASKRTGEILAGRGLYEALLSRGCVMGPVLEVDDETDEEALVVLVSSYAIVQEAWLDPGLEIPLLKDLVESKLGLIGTGYDNGIFERREAQLEEEMSEAFGEGPPTIECPSCHATIEIDRMR